jgi:anti-sigma factor RsiW
MKCQDVVELMTDYLEGALTPRDRELFEAHLATCDGCREYLAQLRKTIELAGRPGDEPIPPHLEQQLLNAFRDWQQRR